MEPINLRVEAEVENQVAKLSDYLAGEDGNPSRSEAARELIYVGLGVEMSDGQIKYKGPLGWIDRPFAGANFEGETVSFGTRLPERTIGRLEGAFQKKKHTAAKEALRTGLILVQIDKIKVHGPFDNPRPLANPDLEGQLEDDRAKEALEKIRDALPENE
jgi:hypothetical protein